MYSDEMVDRWTKEMDTLLVFVRITVLTDVVAISEVIGEQAGLFSAILTAFNVQAYPLLNPSSPDPVLAALQQISGQLSSFSVTPGPYSINSTTSPIPQSMLTPSSPSPPQTWVVQLNILWFSSLIFSLSAALIAILVKQWLSEYNTGLSGTSRQTARLHQYRLDGLIKWRVETIIAILPVLLQIALALFLAGLILLLWNLHHAVAQAAVVLVGLLFLFTSITTILPSFVEGCSYLSPPSIWLFNPIHFLRDMLYQLFTKLYWQSSDGSRLEKFANWFKNKLNPSRGAILYSVHASEKALVEDSADFLDANIFAMAYTTTMDLGYLKNATACFSTLSTKAVCNIFNQIHAENKQYGQMGPSHWTANC